PQLAIAGTECDACERSSARRNLGHLRARGSIEQQHIARIEDGEDALRRVEGHVHGTARDHVLLAPRPQHLVGGHQVVSAGLVAKRGSSFQSRENRGLLGDQSCPGKGNQAKDGLTHWYIAYLLSLTI